jgi:exodeoxyribonuclease-1
MADTYFFYDTETTGLNRAFDQILSFAAIRTDHRLTEIERIEIDVTLRPDVVPSPRAMVVNGIRPERFATGICEYEALRSIHAELNRPGTVSIGYNSIGFDDEFLRFGFHRNLLPPYTHQFAAGCRRVDLLPLTLVCWLHRRHLLHWPELDGKASLRLEDIGAANSLFSGRAHTALSDVEASVRLARLLLKDEAMWDYLDGCFRSDVDAGRCTELPVAFTTARGPHPYGILVASDFGTRNAFQAPVLFIGTSIPYPKQTLWLRLDLPALRETRAENPAATTWIVRKRYGEPGILLPPHDRYLERIDPERRALTEANTRWLASRPDILEAVARHHCDYRYPFIAGLDPDAALYQNGFLPRADELLCREFHAVPRPAKAAVAERFTNRDAKLLARRILFRNYPDAVSGHYADEATAHHARICSLPPVTDFAGNPRTTPQQALSEIRAMRTAPATTAEQLQLLDELERHIRNCFPSLDPRPPGKGAAQLGLFADFPTPR